MYIIYIYIYFIFILYKKYKEKIIYIYNTYNKCNKVHERGGEKELTRDRDKGSYTSTFVRSYSSTLYLFCFCPSYAMFSSLVTNNGVGLSWIFTQYQTRARKSVCNNTSVIFEFDRLSWIMFPLLAGYARLFLDTERKTEQWLDASRSMMFAMNMEDLSMIIVGHRTYAFIKKEIEKRNPPVISLPYVIKEGS